MEAYSFMYVEVGERPITTPSVLFQHPMVKKNALRSWAGSRTSLSVIRTGEYGDSLVS
jgi:hypothetical protein